MKTEKSQLKLEAKQWWEKHPADYYVRGEEGTWQFYQNVDRKWFKWHTPWAQTEYPLLSRLVDYNALRAKKVLEVGCGLGSVLESLSGMGANVAGIDITSKACLLTAKRFRLFSLPGHVLNADAENLPFEDAAFDFVVSWGVLHHTPDTQRSVNEIHRVLKPGGECYVMLYHRNSLFWWYKVFFGWGIARVKLLSHSLQEITNMALDGVEVGGSPLAKVFSRKEAYNLFSKFDKVVIEVAGDAGFDAVPAKALPISKYLVPKSIKQRLATLVGWFLWIKACK